jgi:hypothetical protein
MTYTRRALITILAAAVAAPATVGSAVAQQDKRSPDTKDFADGRPIVASVPFEVVKVERHDGFDWGDAGIGAGGALGLVLVGAGGTVAVVRRRHRAAAVA